MLQNLNNNVADCLLRAAEVERRAREASDPELKANLLDIARRWARLAESYQFVESVDRFLIEAKRYPSQQRSVRRKTGE